MSKKNRKTGRKTGPNNILPIVGKTENGYIIVSKVYEFHESYGTPLDFLFSYLAENKIIPSWIHFYNEAVRNGMNHDRILNKIKDPIEDAYGVEFAKIVIETLNSC